MITPNPPGPYEPTWESLRAYQVPEWYQDAKFGIFIHWGVYSVPAFGNEWYARNMYIQGTSEFEHHLKTFGAHTQFGYKDFIPQFLAPKFDPKEWAQLFATSGAKFVMPVAEHHDGFAMYATKLNPWNSAEMGPKRDIVGELASEVREHGMTFGVSSHRAEHWFFMNGGREFPSDVQEATFQDFYGPAHPGKFEKGLNPPSPEYMEDWLARTVELVDNYRPAIVWFDWWIEQPEFEPYLQRFASYYYNRGAEWGQEVAINYKHHAYPDGTAVFDVERGQLADIRPQFWQTDTAVATNSWSHVNPMHYKPADSLLYDLIDIVSKNGALLLNIGPRADGSIPDEDRAILNTIGAWLSLNGEAIYGTRPWKIYGEGPTVVESGQFKDGKPWGFTAEDIRFTTRGSTLYATTLAPPESSVQIRALSSGNLHDSRRIQKVELVSTQHSCDFQQNETGLLITVPENLPDNLAASFRIRFEE